jgi:putative transposase
MLKAFKYRINPNEEQKVLLAKHFGSVRFLFNRFLNERKTTYEENKAYSNYNLDAAKKIEFNPSAKFLLNTLSVQTTLQ